MGAESKAALWNRPKGQLLDTVSALSTERPVADARIQRVGITLLPPPCLAVLPAVPQLQEFDTEKNREPKRVEIALKHGRKRILPSLSYPQILRTRLN